MFKKVLLFEKELFKEVMNLKECLNAAGSACLLFMPLNIHSFTMHMQLVNVSYNVMMKNEFPYKFLVYIRTTFHTHLL